METEENSPINMKILTEHYNHLLQENTKIDQLLKKLNVDRNVVNRVTDSKTKNDNRSLEEAMVNLTIMEMHRKQRSYIAKMNVAIKAYINKNKMLNSEIGLIKRQFEASKASLDAFHVMSKEELAGLAMKQKRYESELIKYQKKYPYLNDSTLDLVELNNEITLLRKLSTQCANLQMELDEYRGLKPDVFEANEQLARVKLQHQQFKL